MPPRLDGLNQTLSDRRRGLGLTQADAAVRLGVSRETLAKWERGFRSIPHERLTCIGRLYGLDPSELSRLHVQAVKGRPALRGLPGLSRAVRGAVTYPVKGTLEGMLSYGPVARQAYHEVEHRLGAAVHADLLQRFPRDSALELLLAHRLICAGESDLRRVRPLEHLGWTLPMVEHDRDVFSGHRLHHAITVTDGEVRLVVVPQVTLLTRRITSHARLDLLAEISDAEGSALADIEVDGPHHEGKEEDGQQRAIGLGLVRIELTRADILSAHFDARLWRRLRDTLAWIRERRRRSRSR